MGLDARLVSSAFACLPVLCLFRFVFTAEKIRWFSLFLRAEENMVGEKKTN